MFHSFIEGEYKEAIIERAPQNRWLDDPVERAKREEERFQVQIFRSSFPVTDRTDLYQFFYVGFRDQCQLRRDF